MSCVLNLSAGHASEIKKDGSCHHIPIHFNHLCSKFCKQHTIAMWCQLLNFFWVLHGSQKHKEWACSRVWLVACPYCKANPYLWECWFQLPKSIWHTDQSFGCKRNKYVKQDKDKKDKRQSPILHKRSQKGLRVTQKESRAAAGFKIPLCRGTVYIAARLRRSPVSLIWAKNGNLLAY